MRRALTATAVLSAALAGASGAWAQASPVADMIRQEDNKGIVVAATPSPVDRILAQERGRHNDPRLFEGADPGIVQVAGPGDGFDWGDAGLGAGAALAVSLLAAGAIALRRAGGYEAARS